jgi:hypothetical protein
MLLRVRRPTRPESAPELCVVPRRPHQLDPPPDVGELVPQCVDPLTPDGTHRRWEDVWEEIPSRGI